MKGRYYISLILLAGLLAASCSRLPQGETDEGRVGLFAGVAPMETDTKVAVTGESYRGSTPTPTNPLEAAVWFSDTDDAFGTGGSEPTFLPCHSSALFTSDDITYPDDVVRYPTNGSSYAYCVGLYPKTDWSAGSGNATATHPIDGVQDLMFANCVGGTWNNPISNPLRFRHLLTWLKICVCASGTDAITSWGDITKITIANPSTSLAVTLGDGSVAYNGETQNLTAFEGSVALMVTSQELGSLLCAPATSYSVTAWSANMIAGKTVDVPMVNLDSTVPTVANVTGKVYILTLNFHSLTMIDATCTLAEWEDEYQFITGL